MISKKCNKCNTTIPNDMDYCPNCFSHDVSLHETQHKARCCDCGSDVDLSFSSCQRCGSKNIEEYDYVVINNLLTEQYKTSSINFKKRNLDEASKSSIKDNDIQNKKKSIPTWIYVLILIICTSVLLFYSLNGKVNNTDVVYTSPYQHKENASFYDLDDFQKEIYDSLYKRSLDILENKNTSTVIEMPEDYKMTYQEFYTDSLNVLYAFQNDYYYLAWWLYGIEDYYLWGYENNNGSYYDISIIIKPASYYRNGANEKELSKNLVEKAHDAYEKAKSIADETFATNKEALVYFKDWIRENTVYEENVVDDVTNGNFNYNTGMASNFINVFDDKENTNVVCSGYSSAFILLCDLYGIDDCFYVTGYMDDVSHAWNVYIEDGIRYLIDVTNTNEYDDLFLIEIPYESEYNVETTYGSVLYIEDNNTSSTHNLKLSKLFTLVKCR